MKIYINNLNLDIINNIIDIFKDYLVYSENLLNVYTDQGIYMINDKDVFILTPIDKDIQMFENYYKNFTLILDPSFLNKEQTTSINGETHLSIKIKKDFYKMNKKTNIQMIVEYNNNNNKVVPNDIYFEIDKNNDINDINELFIKNEIIEFLSLLN
jgi:hypothetical protein